MSKQPFQAQPSTFKYRGQTYTPLRKLHIRGHLYFIVQEWGSRYKAFDVAVQEMRSIRVREAGAQREMRILQHAKLHSHTIPHIYDFWRNAEKEFLVHEWFDGYTVDHYLHLGRAGKPYFSAERSYFLVRGLVAGLNRLHGLSIFHGDVKPTNVVVTNGDRLVMIDFGAAWTGARTHSRPDEMTRGYAAPEQFQAEPLVDHRADQFATSVLLYQMLTGELPYGGWGGAIINSTKQQLIPPSKKNKLVWSSLDRVVVKGLSLDKNQRYETSAAWYNDFKAAIPATSASPGLFSGRLPGAEFLQHIKTILSDRHPHS